MNNRARAGRESVPRYAEVAPSIPLAAAKPQTYTYRLPRRTKNVAAKYSAVTVPFGKKTVSGVVLRLHNTARPYPVKQINNASQVILTNKQLRFAQWIAGTMQGGIGYTLRLFQPPLRTIPQDEVHESKPAGRPSKTIRQLHEQLRSTSAALITSNRADRQHSTARLAALYAAQGKQVLTLVPEKWMLEGAELSMSADTKRADLTRIWHGVRANTIAHVTGTQKALFLPYQKLSLIILEEEAFASHKLWDQYPRLHNQVAVDALAAIHGCPILYASSYVSPRLQYLKESGAIKIIGHAAKPPTPSLMPFDQEDTRRRRPLPNQAIKQLQAKLKENKSVLLFYNRRSVWYLKKYLAAKLGRTQARQVTISTSAIFTDNPDQTFESIYWLCPEQSITYPDYRSTERARVLLNRLQSQAHQPADIHLITRRQDLINSTLLLPPDQYLAGQLAQRERLVLPPVVDLVRLTTTAKAPAAARRRARALRTALDDRTKDLPNKRRSRILIRGPYQSLEKKGHAPPAWHIVVRGPLADLTQLYSGLDFDTADVAPERIV